MSPRMHQDPSWVLVESRQLCFPSRSLLVASESCQGWPKALGPTTFHPMPTAPGWNQSVPALLHGTLPEIHGQNHSPAYTASSIPVLSLHAGTGLLGRRPLTFSLPGSLLQRWLEGRQNRPALFPHPAPLALIRMAPLGQASIDGATSP